MANYVFPGHKSYFDQAATDYGLVTQTVKGKAPPALTALSNLCAQASTAPRANVAGILLKAATFRNQLLAAGRAADLMIKDVAIARSVTVPPAPTSIP